MILPGLLGIGIKHHWDSYQPILINGWDSDIFSSSITQGPAIRTGNSAGGVVKNRRPERFDVESSITG